MNTSCLWKTCCLENTLKEFKYKVPNPGFQSSIYRWALSRDVANLTFIPGKTHPFQFLGLQYSQFYSCSKEIFDARKTFPFENENLEGLAIDPRLQQVWFTSNKQSDLTWNRHKVEKSYLAGKKRVMISI